MRYFSVCSGIEAATLAFQPLGWQPVGFSEIDKFCGVLLKHYYPDVENYGDIRNLKIDKDIDLLIGGTPCQSFSIAGNMEGIKDERGRLVYEFIRLLHESRPKWFIWENVSHLLQINKGGDFRAILSKITKCGYSVCWRVLDARYFGVPQFRRRIYIVGFLGDWRTPAKALFDCGRYNGDGAKGRRSRTGGSGMDKVSCALTTRQMRNNLSAETFVPFNNRHQGQRIYDISSVSCTLNSGGGGWGTNTGLYKTIEGIRRLTPLECERVQGLPDNYTNIIYRRKPASDTARYRVIGQSMPVPVIHWLGKRIEYAEKKAAEAAYIGG